MYVRPIKMAEAKLGGWGDEPKKLTRGLGEWVNSAEAPSGYDHMLSTPHSLSHSPDGNGFAHQQAHTQGQCGGR